MKKYIISVSNQSQRNGNKEFDEKEFIDIQSKSLY